MKYKEIHKLHEMLLEAGIEHEWRDRRVQFDPVGKVSAWQKSRNVPEYEWGWQIVVYYPDGERMISAIEGWGTYGEERDLIEIMGLLTPEESKYDSVAGYLTAEDVFSRIERAVRNENR